MEINAGDSVGIIGNRLYPFNEAYANQAKALSQQQGLNGFTTSEKINGFYKKVQNFHIVTSRFLDQTFTPISYLNGGYIYAMLKIYEGMYDYLLLFGGIESEFLNHINLSKCIPIVSTIDDQSALSHFSEEISPKLPKIIVQSRRAEEQLREAGVNNNRLSFMYPLVDSQSLQRTEPPSLSDGFRFLFASAPNTENPGEDMFKAKGLPLLLEAFSNHLQNYDSELYLLWRNHHNSDLKETLEDHSISDNVKIINKVVNVNNFYDCCHATLIPYQSDFRSPAYPLSALESIYCGRPIITTEVTEAPFLTEEYGCGLTTEPNVKKFTKALDKLCKNYRDYQQSCPPTTANIFAGDLTRIIG